jgi:hypothetical protein
MSPGYRYLQEESDGSTDCGKDARLSADTSASDHRRHGLGAVARLDRVVVGRRLLDHRGRRKRRNLDHRGRRSLGHAGRSRRSDGLGHLIAVGKSCDGLQSRRKGLGNGGSLSLSNFDGADGGGSSDNDAA